MIRRTDVDGVPTLVAPTSGPMRAGLLFRVGRADEPLARSGVTHLIEHLVLHPLAEGDYHQNGVTGAAFTEFHVQANPAGVAAFLTGVCASLRALPLGRVDAEKGILRTEAAGRDLGVVGPLALWRHGAQGFGVSGYTEPGLPALGGADLVAWVARYFTRQNAVLWIAGDDVPAGLRLDLPAGVRHPVPAVTSALPVTPAYFQGGSTAVAWSAVVPRGAPASVFAAVLERLMFRSLRQESGLSYTAQTDYEPRGDGSAVITAVADGLPEKRAAVLGGFIDVLATVRVGRIDPADVTAITTKRAETLRNVEADAATLPYHARDLLTGVARPDSATYATDLMAVTVPDVVAVAHQAWDTGLLMTPGRSRADWAGFTQAPYTSPDRIQGREYAALDGSGDTLIIGPDGVSLVDEDGAVTVRHDACALVAAWPDGGRTFIGNDAITVRVEPTLFRDAAAAIPGLDALVDPGVRVDLPARDPDRIPQPKPVAPAPAPPAGPSPARARPTGATRVRLIVLAVFFVAAGTVFGGLGLLLLLAAVIDPSDVGFDLIVGLVALAVATLQAIRLRRVIRRLRGQR